MCSLVMLLVVFAMRMPAAFIMDSCIPVMFVLYFFLIHFKLLQDILEVSNTKIKRALFLFITTKQLRFCLVLRKNTGLTLLCERKK